MATKLTGVKGRNALMDLPNFDLKMFPYDPMHVMLENGVLHRVMCYFLAYVTRRRNQLTDKVLNSALLCRVYADGDGSKPGNISVNRTDPRKCNLKMKAMTLMMVALELPFMLQAYVEPGDPHMLHFVLCVRVASAITYAQAFSESSIEYLRQAVARLITEAVELYGPGILTTKWHMLEHIVETIVELGPPKGTSCMPYERHYHTLVRKPVQQFRNVSYTLATRHQKWQASTLFDWSKSVPESVMFEQVKCKSYKNTCKSLCPPWAADLCEVDVGDLESLKEYFQTGVKVKPGSYLDLTDAIGSDHVFGEVLCILKTVSEDVVFCMQEWRSNMYNADLGAFSVTKASRIKRTVSDMKGILVVPVVKHCNRTYVIPKFSTTVF